MKPQEPSMRCLFGSLRSCISHDTFFLWMLPPVLTSKPAQRAGSLSCWGDAHLRLRSLLGFLLLVCYMWSLNSHHMLLLQPRAAVTHLLDFSGVLEEITFCLCSASLVVGWEVWTVLSFSYLQFGYVIRKRADMGGSHFSWIIPKEKLLPCSPCHPHRLLLQSQWGLSCLHTL